MGLFGKNESELRATGTPTTARVTYVDDSGKRRNGDAELKAKIRVQIDSGAARGRELEKTKWVSAARLPRVGDHVSIRIDADGPDDWAWGDAGMYQPGSAPVSGPVVTTSPAAPQPFQPPPPGQAPAQPNNPFAAFLGLQKLDVNAMIQQAFAAGNVTIEHQNQVIDTRGNPELRQQILATLKANGIDVEAMERSGQIPAAPQISATPQPPAPNEDLATRLKRIDELHAQGLLTDDEHREQRQRIIDTI